MEVQILSRAPVRNRARLIAGSIRTEMYNGPVLPDGGYSLMAELQLVELVARVRFPLVAPTILILV